MQGYLATIGRDKVGFSIVGSRADGQPVYVHGTRGVIERNTMRYYVAIEAYLSTMALPPPRTAVRTPPGGLACRHRTLSGAVA